MTDFPSPVQRQRLPIRQRGQALIFGIVVLLGAAVATFYLFNTGQMTAEKTRLVNTADAVAYSAGVMHARALNFEAYTNRALVANEATIAQMVSISSWLEYSQEHVNKVPPMMCQYGSYTPIPVWLQTFRYAALCYILSNPVSANVIKVTDTAFNGSNAGAAMVLSAEVAKKELKAMQAIAATGLFAARTTVMREVAEANYQDNGSVAVLPLKDNWTDFDGGPFISKRTKDGRKRMRDLILDVVEDDKFVHDRSWSDKSWWPCELGAAGRANRKGGTKLNGYDSWEASDDASYQVRTPRFLRSCKTTTYSLGSGHLKTSSDSKQPWYYSGVPDFYELSDKALGYSAASGGPKLQFSVRLTRANGQTRTSGNASGIKAGGRLEIFDSAAAGGVLAAVATSEVFFEHRQADEKVELGSLFNPYWQVHLVSNPAAVTAAALALQGATP
jgi:hypothetical protein